MIVIYTERVTNRLKYVCNFVFRIYFQLDYILVDSIIDIKNDDFVIQYGDFTNTSFLRIPAEGLLHEQGFIRQDWKLILDSSNKIFAAANSSKYLLTYDIFSAVFYGLSMYQAYGNFQKDNHQRIDFKTWNLRTLGLDQSPFLEQWLLEFKNQLLQHFPAIDFLERKFNVEVSFDIDIPFQFRHQSFFNTLKGFVADIVKFRPGYFVQRIQTLLHQNRDGASNFFQLLEDFRIENLRFFHLMRSGKMNSRSLQGQEKRNFVQQLSKYGISGLHPSYFSSSNQALIPEEKNLLESMLGQSISSSRQHFLRFSIPSYFQTLISNGISDDYSIGYYDQPGFLTGVSVPFFFYDLNREEETTLLLHPFVWMDSMYKYYANVASLSKMNEDFDRIIKEVKSVNGCLHVVFHNDTFFNYPTKSPYLETLITLTRC